MSQQNHGSRPVSFEGVRKEFDRKGQDGGRERFVACSDLNFTVEHEERVAIVGATGSGKSTALSLMMGLQPVTSGKISILGYDPHGEFERLRGRVGIIFQSARLLPWRTTLNNAALGLEILGVGKKERRESAMVWLDKLGLAKFAHSHPHQLSGGMQQRVSIARTFVTDPDLILADETFSALDEVTAAAVRSDLLDLIRDTRKTTVFVTHSISEAVEVGERVLVLAAPGEVVASVNVRDFADGTTDGRRRAEACVREELRAANSQGADRGSTSKSIADEAAMMKESFDEW